MDLQWERCPKKAHVHICLLPRDTIDAMFSFGDKRLDSLSVTALSPALADKPARIYLHLDRWLHGPDAAVTVVHPFTGEPIDAKTNPRGFLYFYRTYLLNHELGHACGIAEHENTRVVAGQWCSIMAQQTLSTHGGVFNPWPLPSDRARIRAALAKHGLVGGSTRHTATRK